MACFLNPLSDEYEFSQFGQLTRVAGLRIPPTVPSVSLSSENGFTFDPKSSLSYNNSQKFLALTVVHLLLECSLYTAVRGKYFSVSSKEELFDTTKASNILAFIHEIGFYHHI